MAAVSLTDAWNDPPPAPDQSETIERVVSARASRALVDEHEERASMREDDDAGAVEPRPFMDENYGRLLTEEVKALRVEESRRCTVYLIVAAVLFALLFMYIEKLHGQIRILNSIVYHQMHIPSAGGSAQSQPRTPFQWKQ